MGSVDAEVEIDMEISDDEQENSKVMRAIAGPVVDGRGVKRNSPAGPELADSILFFRVVLIKAHLKKCFGKLHS